MNICLTGLNPEKVKNFAEFVAKKLNYKYVDADEEFAPFLIKSAKYPTVLVDELLKENETKLLHQLKKIDNAVISISSDMFLSNNHSNIFKSDMTIAVLEDDLNDLNFNLQNLLANKCVFNITTKQQLLELIEVEIL